MGDPRWLESTWELCPLASRPRAVLQLNHIAINSKIQWRVCESMCEWVYTWTRVRRVCMSGQEPTCLHGTWEWAAQALPEEQLPLILSNPVLPPVQIQGSRTSVWELWAMGAERDGQGSTSYRNSTVEADLPKAETHWREQVEHLTTALL